MATTVDVPRRSYAAETSRHWLWERAFFSGLTLAMVVAVFVGFSRSYYLKGLYGSPELRPLFHVHGLLFTLWMVLLTVQTGLVASRRTPRTAVSAPPAARSPSP